MRNNKIIIIIIVIVLAVIIALYFDFVFRADKENVAGTETENIENTSNASNIIANLTGEESREEVIGLVSEQGGTLTKEKVRTNIVGIWRSLDREGYRVEFTKEGKIIETLDPQSLEGEWDLVGFNEGPNESVDIESFNTDGVFLKHSLDDGKSNYYYKIVQADKNRLVTIYLNGGGILGFDRIR